jgi:hypothetical protein
MLGEERRGWGCELQIVVTPALLKEAFPWVRGMDVVARLL